MIAVGARLGPYEIIAPLGAGGMNARGPAEPRTSDSEARRQRQFALGVPAFAKATAGPPKLGAKLRAEAGEPQRQ